jgi:hypothetical protein
MFSAMRRNTLISRPKVDRGKRELYESTSKLYVEIAEELEALIDQ